MSGDSERPIAASGEYLTVPTAWLVGIGYELDLQISSAGTIAVGRRRGSVSKDVETRWVGGEVSVRETRK